MGSYNGCGRDRPGDDDDGDVGEQFGVAFVSGCATAAGWTDDDVPMIRKGEELLVQGVETNPGDEIVALALVDTRLQAFRLTNDQVFSVEVLFNPPAGVLCQS
ncbi:MAG: hypothetical protein OXI96_06270 [Acidimicrobiaceae bacterium]|nr:hypothetical protein [Acidimicrobiaceae bacterium]